MTKSDLMMVSFDGKKTLYIKEYANVYGSDVGHRRMAKLPTIFQSCITIAQKIIATSCQEKQWYKETWVLLILFFELKSTCN